MNFAMEAYIGPIKRYPPLCAEAGFEARFRAVFFLPAPDR